MTSPSKQEFLAALIAIPFGLYLYQYRDWVLVLVLVLVLVPALIILRSGLWLLLWWSPWKR